MAFPKIVAFTSDSLDADGKTTIELPVAWPTKQDRLLLAFLNLENNGNITWNTAGWTERSDGITGGDPPTQRRKIFYRYANGTEDDNISFDVSDTSCTIRYACFGIDNIDKTVALNFGADQPSNTATATIPIISALTPGVERLCLGMYSAVQSPSLFPNNAPLIRHLAPRTTQSNFTHSIVGLESTDSAPALGSWTLQSTVANLLVGILIITGGTDSPADTSVPGTFKPQSMAIY